MEYRTPLKVKPASEINSPNPENDGVGTTVTLTFSYKYLRQLEKENIIEEVNKSLKTFKLKNTERIKDRFYKLQSRLKSDYKKVKGGSNKSKFDKKEWSMSVNKSELQENTNNGLRVDNSSSRNKLRVVKKLETHTSEALGFMEQFGVTPKKLMCESFSGDKCIINIDGSWKESLSYSNMTTDSKANVKHVTHLCDSTMISDSAYHELAVLFPDMPRKSHLTACRHELNSEFEIYRTPGMLPGSYLSLRSELEKDIKHLENKSASLSDKIRIKLSGDGTRVSKVSNFLVFSYSWVDLDDSQNQSHFNQRVLAIVNCDETYSNLSKSLAPLFNEICELNSSGKLTVGERSYELEFFVGGDMKFIQILLGLNGSLATYACPWCKVSKDCRGDISLPHDFWQSPQHLRTFNDLRELSSKTCKIKYGVVNPPMLNIEVDHYVPDELHLMMRIMDVLMRNMIWDAQSKDQYAKITNQPTDNLSLLVNAIQSCGVSFHTWVTKGGELEWTSLSGNDKKKVLELLPDKLIFCLHPATTEKVTHLWNTFKEIYALVTKKDIHFDYSSVDVHKQIHKFMQNFLELGTLKREGYQPKNITPYLHTLLFHVPFFCEKYGSLAKFSGQSVEKTNDVLKQIHQSKSNKHDITLDALLTRKRVEKGHLNGLTRKKGLTTNKTKHTGLMVLNRLGN